jgi:FixJ family two-component response regulator
VVPIPEGGRTRVYLVDDDRAVRDALKFILELDGMTVRTWESGALLLGGADLAIADCLVLDCKMPGLDGFAVVKALSDRHVQLPIIMITAPVTMALERRARLAGIYCVLEKPLLNGILSDAVRRATVN